MTSISSGARWVWWWPGGGHVGVVVAYPGFISPDSILALLLLEWGHPEALGQGRGQLGPGGRWQVAAGLPPEILDLPPF